MWRGLKYPILPILNFILLLVIAVCTKEIVVDDNLPKNTNGFEKRYLKEGFIDNNTYRIVIILDKLNAQSSTQEVTEKGIKRTRISLQTYLMSENRIIDSNVKAKILNLINDYGKLSARIIENAKSEVYYFELNKDNLKHYIDKMAQKR